MSSPSPGRVERARRATTVSLGLASLLGLLPFPVSATTHVATAYAPVRRL
ncbi:MAG TPA: hypothetical protein VIN09_00455 [Chloroflexota bacterium]